MSASPNPEEIRDYLLRRMPEGERSRFETAYFRDDSLLDRIEAEEDALVSDYVLGRLDENDRRLFEESLLGTPYYRERVETTTRLRLRVGAPGLFPTRFSGVPGGDAGLFPGRTGVTVVFALLTLLLVASLLSALRLKSDLTRARLELAAQPPQAADPAGQAGVVPLAQTVVLSAERSTAPISATLKRVSGGVVLLSFSRSALAGATSTWSVALLQGTRVAWESGALPPREPDAGDVSVRLPKGVPPAGSYSVLLRIPGSSDRPEVPLGVLEILDP